MSDVQAIEAAVSALPPHDLAQFRAWFAEFDAALWDGQIAADLAAGKLDSLLNEARADYAAGPTKAL
jgi:hypothetical protein